MSLTDSPRLSISAVAQATGLSTSTLRYYEQEGLMRSEIDRATSSHRRYTDADLNWVAFITRLRSTGMPIRDIRRYTELAREGDSSAGARLALLTEHRDRVLGQLDEVTGHLAAIEIKIGMYKELTGE